MLATIQKHLILLYGTSKEQSSLNQSSMKIQMNLKMPWIKDTVRERSLGSTKALSRKVALLQKYQNLLIFKLYKKYI